MKKIITILKHIYRGSFCELPNYGYHPGTGIVLILLIAHFAVASWPGVIMGSLVYLPIYSWGAYRRSVEDPETKTK